MLTALLFPILLQAGAPSASDTVVVKAQRDASAAHADCVRKQCTPTQDANVTLAYAEQRVLAGDYYGAERALKAAVSRTRSAARTHPRSVSALYSGLSTVALHLGDETVFRRAAARAITVLGDSYGPDDPRTIAARARMGDIDLARGRYQAADEAYRAAADAARRKKLDLLADTLDLRRAWLVSLLGAPERSQARLVATAEDASVDRRVRMQAAVLAARVAGARGDGAVAERMLAQIGQQPSASATPILVSAPRIALTTTAKILADAEERGDSEMQEGFGPRSMDFIPLRWIDVGFWIRPDGRVEEAEVLRGSPSRDWAKPVIAAVADRRYAPFGAEMGDPGQYRVERFTLTAEKMVPIGSLIARRAGPLELRQLDITRNAGRPAAINPL